MRKTLLSVAASTITCGCLAASTAVAHAQAARKPGLWETTSSMTFQKSPLPPGMQAPPGSPFSGAPHTTQVCVTEAMIDKFGGPSPAPQRGDCTVTDVAMKPNGMTAAISCTGQMAGSGTVAATFTDANTGQTTVHFTGTMTMGPRSAPIEWTMQASSTYKGADCGSVKPIEMK